MGKTTIEWTATTRPDGRVSPGYTFNPWWGCSKVAEGCAHCYAEAFSKRTGRAQWGVGGTRVKMSESYWRQPLKWDRESKAAGERRRVFCASMADVFEDWPGRIVNSRGEVQWWRNDLGVVGAGGTTIDHSRGERLATMGDLRHDLFALIDSTPNLDWLVLTKRPENIRRMWCSHANTDGLPPSRLYRPNVWIGTSVASQDDAERNLPHLLQCGSLAPVLFVSAEPLLDRLDLTAVEAPANLQRSPNGGLKFNALTTADDEHFYLPPAAISFVIVGGESGPKARPCRPEWIRSIVSQCRASGTACFVKQLGANVVTRNDMVDDQFNSLDTGWPDPDVEHHIHGYREDYQGADCRIRLRDKKGGDVAEWPEDIRVREFPMVEATR